MKPTIVALVGASGCGKTTLSLYLQEHFGIPAICSYTTRPMREGEVNGREHWFVGPEYAIPAATLAYTFFGGHHYWTEPAQINSPVSTYVIDEKGLIELKNKWNNAFKIIAIHIKRPDLKGISEERKQRDTERIHIPIDFYNIEILNDKDLETFFKVATTAINNILNYGTDK